MNKLFLVALIIVSAFAFNIKRQNIVSETQLKAINWPFTTCGDGRWKIEKLTLSAQPARNTNDSIVVLGTAKDSITFKQAVLNVKLNGTPLHSENIPFAAAFDNGDTVQFKFANFIPGFAPSGTYGMTFTFVNSDNKNQGCIAFNFKL